MQKTFTINIAAKLSGLTELIIRTWEKRYNVVEPQRTKSNRRLYSEADIDKLITLNKLTKNGYRIGSIASLPLSDLKSMLIEAEVFSKTNLPKSDSNSENIYNIVVQNCLEAIGQFNAQELEKILADASMNYSQPILIDQIILPMMEKIGDLWREGLYRVAHEHFTSAIIRKFLSNISEGYNIQDNAPRLVVTTPQGQYHETGALIGGLIASSDGWKITYMGPSLPAEEIVFVVNKLNSKVLLLSLVYPDDDPLIVSELKKIRDLAGDQLQIIVSGKAVGGYLKILSSINAIVVFNTDQLNEALQKTRKFIKFT
ncbi:MAG: MerR family transcriptional regulator [Bacteroidetes bacterium]|nr:MerR family transcriptional regulator [Bacteroidota bacterium]